MYVYFYSFRQNTTISFTDFRPFAIYKLKKVLDEGEVQLLKLQFPMNSNSGRKKSL